METRVFCVELKMGPSGHMDSTGIFPDSNTREFGPRRTKQRQPPRPTPKCNAPRLPFHVHLAHDLTRAASALPLVPTSHFTPQHWLLSLVSFGIALVQVQVHCRVVVSEHPQSGPLVPSSVAVSAISHSGSPNTAGSGKRNHPATNLAALFDPSHLANHNHRVVP